MFFCFWCRDNQIIDVEVLPEATPSNTTDNVADQAGTSSIPDQQGSGMFMSPLLCCFVSLTLDLTYCLKDDHIFLGLPGLSPSRGNDFDRTPGTVATGRDGSPTKITPSQ